MHQGFERDVDTCVQVKGNVSNPELSEKAAAIVAEINTVIAEAELPALRTVINFHAIRCIVERAATALERAGDSARASAEMAFAQRQVAAGVPHTAAAYTFPFLSLNNYLHNGRTHTVYSG